MTPEERDLTEPLPAPSEDLGGPEGGGEGVPGPADDTPRRATARLAALALLAVGALAYLRVWPPLDSVMSAGVEPTVAAAGKVVALLASPLGLIWVVGGLVLLLLLPHFERRRDSAELLRETRENREVVAELAGAVGEYGRHLRSHTEVLKAMSTASGDLAATVAALREVVPEGGADTEGGEPAVPPAPRALLDPRLLELGPRPGDIPPPLLNWRGR